jgi:Zn-finger nucleic acid-binding protein
MHRRNFGRKSGIIVDTCRSHGIWFDAHELDGVIRWVRNGGEVAVEQLHEQEKREAERQVRLKRQLEPAESDWPTSHQGPGALVEFLGWLVRLVIDR